MFLSGSSDWGRRERGLLLLVVATVHDSWKIRSDEEEQQISLVVSVRQEDVSSDKVSSIRGLEY